MKIKKITSQNRRDFSAIMVCEHCGKEENNKYGYDDDNYHNNVIPNMKCKSCGEKCLISLLILKMDTLEPNVEVIL